jgi:hypothetical protein
VSGTQQLLASFIVVVHIMVDILILWVMCAGLIVLKIHAFSDAEI